MSDKRQKLLLLGGTGFLGSNLAQALVASGHDVFVTGFLTDDMPLPAGVQYLSLTLGAVEETIAFIASERIDTVVHLVSTMKPSSTLDDYLTERDTVLNPLMKLAAGLADSQKKLVYFSSGGTIYGSGSGERAAEDDPCDPISFYGQSKLEIETYLRFLERVRRLRSLIIRPSNPYGPRQSLNSGQGLISVLLGRVLENRPLEIWGDGSSVRDYIHVDDLVASTCALIEHGVENTVLNLGSGEGHSLMDVVRIVEEVTGRQIALDFRPARPADVKRLVLDTGRLTSMGLYRSRPLAEGIRSYAKSLGISGGHA